MSSIIKVEILGEEYPVRTATENEQHLKNIVKYLNDKIDFVKSNITSANVNKVLSNKDLAVLTALNIADDYFKQKHENKKIIEELEEKIKMLTSSLDMDIDLE